MGNIHEEKARQLSFFKLVSIEVVNHCGHAFSLFRTNLSARIWIPSIWFSFFLIMGSRQYNNILSGMLQVINRFVVLASVGSSKVYPNKAQHSDSQRGDVIYVVLS